MTNKLQSPREESETLSTRNIIIIKDQIMANVLIVDDSSIIKRMLSKIVGDSGHSVVATGSDGNEGVELYNCHKPDLVLLDITMPNKSGKDCLQDILTDHPEAKVIMFTSVSDHNTLDDCLNLGAKAFIKKEANLLDPENSQKIKDTIDSVLAA